MPAFPRAELDEMVRRWLAANQECEQTGDWRSLASMYTPGASYGWNMGPGEEFMVAGRDQIRDVALALEMGGLDGWSYPYQKVLIDDQQGEVVGFWKQVAAGGQYQVAGIGGSWFRYGGDWQWDWQRDFFDLGNATALFLDMLKAGDLSDGMRRRMERAASGEKQPGHYRIGEGPVPLW
jgi:hypothetical protein